MTSGQRKKLYEKYTTHKEKIDEFDYNKDFKDT